MSHLYGHYDGRFHIVGDGRVLVYTDGCCFDNGKPYARGGYGVYFGPNHPYNLSEPLPDGRQTNQRAEILAAYHALRIIHGAGYKRAEVRTDSKFLIACIEEYIPNWQKYGWATVQGHTPINKEELDLLVTYDSEMDVRYIHVPRGSNPWNSEADKLAKQGAGRRHV